MSEGTISSAEQPIIIPEVADLKPTSREAVESPDPYSVLKNVLKKQKKILEENG